MLRTSLLAIFLSAALMYAQAPDQPRRPSLRERAETGDAEAQFTLGKNYEAGRSGLKKDYTQAQHWYRQAALQSDPFAQASLAILYRFGKGVPQDNVQAYMWFQLAIDRLTGADRQSIQELQDATAARMNPEQVVEARRLAREWKPEKTQ